MSGLKFTITFNFEVIPDSLKVDLCAEIQLVTNTKCIVTNVHRLNADETPLLPALTLVQKDGNWIHENRSEKSRIGSAIGEQIDKFLIQVTKTNSDGVVP